MIEIRDLSKHFGRREALAGVSLTLGAGQVTLLLGANGAGKSTLLRCLLGITSFDGDLRVGGIDPRASGAAVRAAVGYMPQTGGLHPDLTVRETMTFHAAIRRVPAARGAMLLEEAGLSTHLSAKVGELSGGLRQRLGFALALLSDPRLLVLDEPGASLDAAGRRWLAGRLRSLADDGRTVVVSTHGGDELLAAADRRITLEDGRLTADEASSAAPPAAPPRTGPAPVPGALSPIVRKELRDALRNRWLIGYAVLLGVLGLAATATGLDSTSGLALQAYGRTTATLMNLCLLVAPLVAVLMGAGAIAGEQERGTLEYLLAQPITRTGLLRAKFAGLIAALTAATAAGFAPAGVLIAAAAGPGLLAPYLLFPGIAAMAGAALAAVGLFISVTSRSAAQAQGTAVFTWFAFVLLYDLLLIGLLAASGLPAGWLAAALVANPVDAARVLGVLALEPDLYLLGPAGAWLTSRWSPGGAALWLLAALAAWTVLPVIGAAVTFSAPLTRKGSHEKTRDRSAAGLDRLGGRHCVHVGRGAAGTKG